MSKKYIYLYLLFSENNGLLSENTSFVIELYIVVFCLYQYFVVNHLYLRVIADFHFFANEYIRYRKKTNELIF
ncbi:hypothetical protein Lepto7376_1072 [[Leptolyngbya] sp. PCC 7376]|nr:hypothetical protein Lepto7376_1072 [[Leptolyngbya] sp. PCC 7376]